jgi:hypothetical protein
MGGNSAPSSLNLVALGFSHRTYSLQSRIWNNLEATSWLIYRNIFARTTQRSIQHTHLGGDMGTHQLIHIVRKERGAIVSSHYATPYLHSPKTKHVVSKHSLFCSQHAIYSLMASTSLLYSRLRQKKKLYNAYKSPPFRPRTCHFSVAATFSCGIVSL